MPRGTSVAAAGVVPGSFRRSFRGRPCAVAAVAYAGGMGKSSIWTVVGVIVAVVIAWVVVDAIFSLLFFIGKLMIVALVAVVVYFLLRGVFAARD